METSASVTISTEQKLRNLILAMEALHSALVREGRGVAATLVDIACHSLVKAQDHFAAQTPGHD